MSHKMYANVIRLHKSSNINVTANVQMLDVCKRLIVRLQMSNSLSTFATVIVTFVNVSNVCKRIISVTCHVQMPLFCKY